MSIDIWFNNKSSALRKKKKKLSILSEQSHMEVSCRGKVLGLYRNKRKYAQKNKITKSQGYVCACERACTQQLKRNKKSRGSYLGSCIVRVSKLRERHSCFFCYHQQYSSPLIDCNQFYFKSTVLHTFPTHGLSLNNR